MSGLPTSRDGRLAHYMDPGQPLWKIVPTRDERGLLLSDFMMLIPGLKSWPETRQQDTLNLLHLSLTQFPDVVFANLNLRLNLLWVSLRPRPGAIMEIATAVRARVPEAVLVSHKFVT